jgi:putative PEP-CTERM system TPR-repeat lipoprotein
MPLLLGGCDKNSNLTVQERIERANEFEAKGDIKSAIIELKNAVQKEPGNAQARWRLGELYIKNKEGASSEKELEKARELGVAEEPLKYPLGQALLLQEKYQEALDRINPTKDTSSTNFARILHIRASALMGLKHPKEACDMMLEAREKDQTYIPTYWGLSRCAASQGRLEEARALLESALKLNPKDSGTWLALGDMARGRGDMTAALEAYNNSIKFEPLNDAALVSRAAVLLGMGKTEQASQDIAAARKASPQNPDVKFMQAVLDFRNGKYAAAHSLITEVLKKSPGPQALLLYGATSYARGEYEQSVKSLGQLLSLAPGSKYARKVMASAQLKLGLPQEALATLTPLLSEASDDPDVLSLAADLYMKAGNPGKATQYLEKAAALNPEEVGIRTNLGLSRLAVGDTQQALADLGAAADMDKQLGLADNMLLMVHMRQGQYDQALAAISRMEQQSPKSPYLFNVRSAAYAGKKDYANARRSLEQALAVDPTYFPAAANLAILDLQDNKPDAARGRYESILAKDKNDLRALLALAKLAQRTGKPEDAVTWLQRAAKAHPKSTTPKRLLAMHYLEQRQPLVALPYAREANNIDPTDPGALDVLGLVQLEAGEKDNAVVSFQRLITLVPGSAEARVRLAGALAATGDKAGARKALDEALQIKPGYLGAASLRTALDLNEGKYSEALKGAREMQRSHPKDASGLILEGNILMAQRQYAAAAKSFEGALALAATGPTMIRLHQALIHAGNREAAQQKMSLWVKDHPEDATARMNLAVAYLTAGQNKQAIEQYQAVLQLQPQNAMALNDLAWAFHQVGDPRALAHAEKAYQLSPKNPQVLDTLGWIQLSQGQKGKALDLLSQAADLTPKDPAIRYHLGVALDQAGKRTEARLEMQKALAGGNFRERNEAQAYLARLK